MSNVLDKFPTFQGPARRLVARDYADEAKALQVQLAMIHAFSDVESGSTGGFLGTGEPVILFEARYFHVLTKGRFDRVNPNVSSPVWDRTLYGAGGVHQYHRLRQAIALDRTAALQSASLGRYQIMGANFGMLGFDSVDDMWIAFCDSERAHLDGFAAYCRKAGLVRWMRPPPNFLQCALGYNGPGARVNHYDDKLAARYRFYVGLGEGTIPRGARHTGTSHAEDPATIGEPEPTLRFVHG